MNISEFNRRILAFMRVGRSTLLVAPCLIYFLFPFIEAHAQGNLLITPRRIVFEGTKKSHEVNLANSGKDTARYVVSFVQVRMKEDGTFEWIKEPDPEQNFSDRYIRYYPRTVVLAPEEAQTVKIELYNTNRLASGEYRSHMYFRAIPEEKPLGEDKKTVSDSTSFTVSLTPVFGITIPIIIRIGKSTAAVTMTDVSLEVVNDSISKIKYVLNRSGNMSVYGDIKVTHISPQGQSTQIGMIGGLAVYTPNPVRRCQFDLNTPRGLNLHQGRLRVEYVPSSDIKAGVLAQTEITLR